MSGFSVCAEMASRIERWPIERLVPYERNARTHSPQQIRQIADSIREFGFTNPILVDAAAGIIAGHARLWAARDLHLTEVPVIVLSHLSEAQNAPTFWPIIASLWRPAGMKRFCVRN